VTCRQCFARLPSNPEKPCSKCAGCRVCGWRTATRKGRCHTDYVYWMNHNKLKDRPEAKVRRSDYLAWERSYLGSLVV
jgi:hypothetical protein